MEEAQTSQSLNPHAKEFHPSSSNYSHHYHHTYPSNYPPPPTSRATTTAITPFLSPPPPPAPPVLLPHQQFPQNNYQNYPYPLNTVPDYYCYYPKPLSLSQNTPPLHPLLHPPPPPPSPTRPHLRRVKPEAAEPSGSGSGNIRRRRIRGQSCNFGSNGGLISHDPQGQNGSVHHHGGAGRVWVERVEKKNKKLWGRERKKKEVMPVKPQGMETTVMIRNVPNQYTRRMLMDFLDDFCNEENQRLVKDGQADHQSVAYDFLYLPMDFRTDANKGYAFVNFTQPGAVQRLHCACDNKRWKHCSSSKICQIACAAIQGKENLAEHFGRSRFMCDNDEYLPVCFSPPRDGSGSAVTQTIVGERVKPSSLLRN